VPPPNHLALVGTLLVHPLHTSGASSRERLEVSSESLILLQNVLAILGPVGGNLNEAFAFTSSRSRRGGAYIKKESSTGIETGSPISGDGNIKSTLAKDNSLWMRAQDFWHVVGWAFNCSIRHPKRWEYWRTWLEYMLDVLKADWDERARLDTEENKSRSLDPRIASAQTQLKNSILLEYLPERGGSSTALRRVVKSIFADGSVEAMRAYPEVFENETRERNRQAGTKRKREQKEHKVEIDEDNYGDYIGDDECEEGDPTFDASQPTPPPSRDQDDARSQIADYSAVMGGPEAIVLRLRLLALVSHLSGFCDLILRIPAIFSIRYSPRRLHKRP
jgi:ribosomal protein S21